ncbi:MAG: D-alanyl-D-alanine carboxypeptidase [Treponema sp.]|jgi:D-alanyl-D-alanine carboxypeptidase (penicillin-binding protein 5/6)|nr:D-alanyl-D-alanine carboxypeptidase [Treponema sp.]
MRKKIFCIIIFTFNVAFSAFAQYFSTPRLLAPYAARAPEIISRAAVLIDAETGALLYSKNQDEEIPPASLAKLMTMHLVMKEIEAGRVSLEETVPVTAESWAQNQPPRSSLMFLAPGQTVTLREIMLGMAVPSGNDAAVAAALRLAPSVNAFANMMTEEARRMGLRVTRFVEPSGISENNMTTAGEYAFFCRQYLRLHPWSLKTFHSVPVFAYPEAANVSPAFRNKPGTIVQYNRNRLLITFQGADGLKTGYIDEAGYNFALTAMRGQTRFIAVILGAPPVPGGDRIRDEDGEKLLSWAFDNFKTVRPVIGKIEKARVWKGKANDVELELAHQADFTSPADRAYSLWFDIIFDGPLIAPFPSGFPAGHLIINDELGELNRVSLVTASACEKGNIFKRLWHSILLFFKKNNV